MRKKRKMRKGNEKDDFKSDVVSATCSVIGCVMMGVGSVARETDEDSTTGAAMEPSSDGICKYPYKFTISKSVSL